MNNNDAPQRQTRKQPIRQSGFSPDKMPDEIKQGIGDLIAHWSYVAFQVGVIIRECFGLNKDIGFALLFSANMTPLCRSLRLIGKTDQWVKDKPLREEILALAADIQKKDDRRNDFAHGVFGWKSNKAGQEIFIRYRFDDFSVPRNGQIPHEKVTTQMLTDLTDEAHDLGRRAQDITVTLKRRPRR